MGGNQNVWWAWAPTTILSPSPNALLSLLYSGWGGHGLFASSGKGFSKSWLRFALWLKTSSMLAIGVNLSYLSMFRNTLSASSRLRMVSAAEKASITIGYLEQILILIFRQPLKPKYYSGSSFEDREKTRENLDISRIFVFHEIIISFSTRHFFLQKKISWDDFSSALEQNSPRITMSFVPFHHLDDELSKLLGRTEF